MDNWVAFDYGAPVDNSFRIAIRLQGFKYYFHHRAFGKTINYTLTDPFVRSGKYATASLNDAQSYYLKRCQNPSTHKALYLCDIFQNYVFRNDWHDSVACLTVKMIKLATNV
jgi:hypothetical protein